MSDLQLIDDLCDICVQLAGIVRRQAEVHGQVSTLEDEEREATAHLSSVLEV